MKKLVFATNNAHKLSEIRAMLANKVTILSLADIGCTADIPETANTLEGNALLKARYVFERYGFNCFADDTGLEVTALNGLPGVHTARYAGETNDTRANVAKLLAQMSGKTDRSARFRTVIALIEDGAEQLFAGVVEGEIATEERGTDGFGYDPVFCPLPQPSSEEGTSPASFSRSALPSFAELGVDEKNRISHRARAVQKLYAYLENL